MKSITYIGAGALVLAACASSAVPASSEQDVTKNSAVSPAPSASSDGKPPTPPAVGSATPSSGGAATPPPAGSVPPGAANLASCCSDRAKCVPESKVPQEQLSNLTTCPGSTDKCVPNEMLTGTFQGKPCSGTISVLKLDYAGVCLSDCLGIEQANFLSRDGCGTGELCVPCIHPITGAPTGAPGCK
jgi:hypothetical protein